MKVHSKPVGRPDVQRFVGASIGQYENKLFFSSMGYTAGAFEYATKQNVALFTIAPNGTVAGVNGTALRLYQASGVHAAQLRSEEAKRKREEAKREREAAEALKTPAQKKKDDAVGSCGCAVLLIPVFALPFWYLLSTWDNPVNWLPENRGGVLAFLATTLVIIGLSAWGSMLCSARALRRCVRPRKWSSPSANGISQSDCGSLPLIGAKPLSPQKASIFQRAYLVG